MRSKTLQPGTSITPDYEDFSFTFEDEAFDRFADQIDEALDELVARWINRAAPASRACQRSSCTAGR